MQEASHLKWVNVDMDNRKIRVREDVTANATIKDRGERTINMSLALQEVLAQWRKVRPRNLLVLGTAHDSPNRTWLKTLKRLARTSQLNCGDCRGCARSGDCGKWTLKKFRSTFTTTLLRSGMDARSVMEQTGHENIETVMLYWKPLSLAASAAKMDEIQWASVPAPIPAPIPAPMPMPGSDI